MIIKAVVLAVNSFAVGFICMGMLLLPEHATPFIWFALIANIVAVILGIYNINRNK